MTPRSSIVKKTIVAVEPLRIEARGALVPITSSDKPLPVNPNPSTHEEALYEKVKTRIQQDLQTALQKQHLLISEQAREEVSRTILAFEADLLKLALAAAEKVCRKEITDNQELVREVIREGLAVLGRRASTAIRLHPDDMSLIQSSLPSLVENPSDIHLSPDSTVERGGAVLESGAQMVDAQVVTRLHALRETLLGHDHA